MDIEIEPTVWLQNSSVQCLSLHDQGFLLNLACLFATTGSVNSALNIADHNIKPDELARLLRRPEEEVCACMFRLILAGIVVVSSEKGRISLHLPAAVQGLELVRG